MTCHQFIDAGVADREQLSALARHLDSTALPSGPVAPFTAGPLIPGPWWPPVDYPCQCITTPPDVPPVAPVPVPASAGLLIAAVAVLALWRRK